jgi:exodeoxyribonuclease VII small subunit
VADDNSTGQPGSADEPLSFEQALTELQQVVDELEEGSVGLEESMRRFERGTALLRHCYGLLEHAEQRIEILTGRDAAGNVETAPFDASATHESAAPKAGRRIRKMPAKPRPAAPLEETDPGDTLF